MKASVKYIKDIFLINIALILTCHQWLRGDYFQRTESRVQLPLVSNITMVRQGLCGLLTRLDCPVDVLPVSVQ